MTELNDQRLKRFTKIAAATLITVGAIYLTLKGFRALNSQLEMIKEAKDRITLQNEVFKTAIQLVGGAFLLVGLYFTWKTIRVNQEGQITDRFSKAIDHLGQDNTSIRLGGIYALARIANDSTRDALTVAEIFSAFVRQATSDSRPVRPSTEVTSILKLLTSGQWANGQYVDLTGAYLQTIEIKYADLRNATLVDIDLSNARLYGCRMDGANLNGAELQNCYLRDSILRSADLTAARFQGAMLRNAQLQGAAIFGINFDGANLMGVNFEGATGAIRQQFHAAILDESTRLPRFEDTF